MAFNEALNPYVQKVKNHGHIVTHADIFDEAPLHSLKVLDLGCGNGHFLQERLRSDATIWGIGVEQRFKRAFKTAEKIESTTSKVIQMDLVEFLQSSPPNFWDEIWLQFPDPWPKARHEKNRSVNAGNLLLIFQALKPGGYFRFRSDCKNYFDVLLDLHGSLKLFPVCLAQQGDIFQDYPKTLFQRKFLSQGIPIYSVEMRK